MNLFSPVVVPGKRLGSFELGSQISVVAKTLAEDAFTFRNVCVNFNVENVSSEDIVFDLVDSGVLLRFDSTVQRLKMFELYNLKKLTVFYCGTACCGPSVSPSFRMIYNLFGPTYPGKYDESTQLYWLCYPGISFAFPISPDYARLYQDSTDLPSVLPDGSSPVASKMMIMHGLDHGCPTMPPLPEADAFYMELVKVQTNKGITWTGRRRSLGFESTPQDVMCELGAPSSLFSKRQDKVRIHGLDITTSSDGGVADYFYNYPSLGVDILFDGRHHVIKKFVLYTNHPLDRDFNEYNKCNFELTVPSGQTVTPDSNWASIQKIFGDNSQPAVYDDDCLKKNVKMSSKRSSSSSLSLSTASSPSVPSNSSNNINSSSNNEDDDSEENPLNFFGSSLFFGYPGVVFHVSKSGALLSIILFAQNQT